MPNTKFYGFRKLITHLQQATPSVSVLCLLCRGQSSYNRPVCSDCLNILPVANAQCSLCSLPMPDSCSELCAQCLQHPPVFDQCLTAYIYDYPVNHIIQHIKYSRRLELIPPLVTPLIDVLFDHYQAQSWPEAIVPVPLHEKKLRSRGFNQALLIAKRIRKAIPSCIKISHCIKKKHETVAQQGLSAQKRRKNIKNAFTLCQEPNYQHVAIVDDVMTTGATVSEIGKVLKRKGVKQVDIWCLARTP